MSGHFSNGLFFDIELADFAIGFAKDENFWILLSVLSEGGDSVGREVKRIGFLGSH